MQCKFCGQEDKNNAFTNNHICPSCVKKIQLNGRCRFCGEKFVPKYQNSTKCDLCREKRKTIRKKEIESIFELAKRTNNLPKTYISHSPKDIEYKIEFAII